MVEPLKTSASSPMSAAAIASALRNPTEILLKGLPASPATVQVMYNRVIDIRQDVADARQEARESINDAMRPVS